MNHVGEITGADEPGTDHGCRLFSGWLRPMKLEAALEYFL